MHASFLKKKKEKKKRKLQQRAADNIRSPLIHEYLSHSPLDVQFNFKADLTGLKWFTFLICPVCLAVGEARCTTLSS